MDMNDRNRIIFSIYTKNLNIKVLSISTLLLIYILNSSLDIVKMFFLIFTSIFYIVISITIDHRRISSLHLLLIDSILIYFTMINYIILLVSFLNIGDIMRTSLFIYGLIAMNQAIVIKFSKHTLSSSELVLGFLIINILRCIFYRNFKLLLELPVILLLSVLCYKILSRGRYMDRYAVLYDTLLVFTVLLMDRSSAIFWCILVLTAITIYIIENFGNEPRYSDIKLLLVFLANILTSILFIIYRIDYDYLLNIMLPLVYFDILLKILFKT